MNNGHVVIFQPPHCTQCSKPPAKANFYTTNKGSFKGVIKGSFKVKGFNTAKMAIYAPFMQFMSQGKSD